MQNRTENVTAHDDRNDGGLRRKLRVYVAPMLMLGTALLFMNGQAVLRDIGFVEFKTLLVTGEIGFVDVKEVQQVARGFAKAGFLKVDMGGLREAVKQVEWVQDARVRREWPATLVIEIIEAEPVAIWGGNRLLGANGDVFGEAGQEFEKLPRLHGPEGTQVYLLSRYGEFKSVLGGTALDFSSLTLSNRWSFELITMTGIRVILGTEEIDDRLHRFVEHALPLAGSSDGRMEQIDLRYSNGFAVKWDEVNVEVSESHNEEELDAQEI